MQRASCRPDLYLGSLTHAQQDIGSADAHLQGAAETGFPDDLDRVPKTESQCHQALAQRVIRVDVGDRRSHAGGEAGQGDMGVEIVRVHSAWIIS